MPRVQPDFYHGLSRGLVFPLGMKYAFLVEPPVGVSTEEIPLGLQQIRRHEPIVISMHQYFINNMNIPILQKIKK